MKFSEQFWPDYKISAIHRPGRRAQQARLTRGWCLFREILMRAQRVLSSGIQVEYAPFSIALRQAYAISQSSAG